MLDKICFYQYNLCKIIKGEIVMKKRIAAVMLAALCALSMAGCLKNTTEEDKAFVCGTVNGNVYESRFSGLKLTAPEGWKFSTEDELLEMMDIATEQFEDDAKKKAAEIGRQKTIYDAMLMDQESGTNVIIMYENMSASIGGSLYSAEEYAGILENNVKSESGYRSIKNEAADFCGEKYHCFIWQTVNANNVGIEQCALIRKVDNYMLSIVFSYVPDSGVSLDGLKGMFEKLPADASADAA